MVAYTACCVYKCICIYVWSCAVSLCVDFLLCKSFELPTYVHALSDYHNLQLTSSYNLLQLCASCTNFCNLHFKKCVIVVVNQLLAKYCSVSLTMLCKNQLSLSFQISVLFCNPSILGFHVIKILSAAGHNTGSYNFVYCQYTN